MVIVVDSAIYLWRDL